MMKRALAVILAAGFAVGSYATDARIAVMGRQGTPYFYRDEVTVFTNPADMSLYPNLIYGSFGWLNPRAYANELIRENLLPQDPFFGGMISHSFSDEDNGPMLSIGAFVNRRDHALERLIAAGEEGEGRPGLRKAYENNLVDPVGKIDIMFGYDIGNGLAFGLGFYGAYQRQEISGTLHNETSILKLTGGINYNIEQGLDLEASVNAGTTGGKFIPDVLTQAGETSVDPFTWEDANGHNGVVSNGDYFLRGDVRFFSAVPSINGSFVPQVSLEYVTLNGASITDLAGGVGLNMNIDRGFFWAGIQGVYTQTNYDDERSDPSSIGARLSFGIERNVVWDWFLIRVGGQKELRYMTLGGDKESKWIENAPSSGTDGDLVGLGFGINIDNRLRIDFVASEDLPYTLTNLISGASHHLFNRVSATYRF